ncbi:hypothetical protein IMCC12053_2445 [Celeribacter marinus]|uniref:Uncharacterized protein n=1 Tax=Celeribacter marinus TaxID=1397108 RepID=A0A0P0AC64_9RHOB|nr:hypothetical protein IMCC12053_2445 [Celeribacter marinus]
MINEGCHDGPPLVRLLFATIEARPRITKPELDVISTP